ERHNGTDRNRNARKVRKTYCFSKDWWIHRAATFFSKYSYNFCWPVRTLKARGGEAQTPAMMAKLTDHVWTLGVCPRIRVRNPQVLASKQLARFEPN
ncbi:MAG: hypothetical protein ACXVAT_12405, partial [Isosphaeraceae bacterium]